MSEHAEEQQHQYSDYLVAFLDILGFKGIVDRSVWDSEYYKKILSALRKIEHVVNHNIEKQISENRKVNMTQFSDSLVISRPNHDLALWPMIMDLDLIQKILAKEGILVRGGLTSGLLYHKGNIAFGPAFIRAYELESKEAIYPRIIIDPDLLDAPSDEIKAGLIYSWKKSNLKEDADGYYFINFLGGYFSDPNDSKELEEMLHMQLSQLQGDTVNVVKVREKLEWLQAYIQSTKG